MPWPGQPLNYGPVIDSGSLRITGSIRQGVSGMLRAWISAGPGFEFKLSRAARIWCLASVATLILNFGALILKVNFDIEEVDIKYDFDIEGPDFDVEGVKDLGYRIYLICNITYFDIGVQNWMSPISTLAAAVSTLWYSLLKGNKTSISLFLFRHSGPNIEGQYDFRYRRSSNKYRARYRIRYRTWPMSFTVE